MAVLGFNLNALGVVCLRECSLRWVVWFLRSPSY